jgi:6-phosphogluconolactonase (cycloisomerase 2 family)
VLNTFKEAFVMVFRSRGLAITAGAVFSLGLGQGRAWAGQGPEPSGPGAVYTLTNSAAGNGLAVMARDAKGNLRALGVVATGGLGTGSGLGSQGGLVMSEDGRTLYAVNAGSNQVSVLTVGPRGPALAQVVDSGGQRPVSIALHDQLLYVLHNGGAAGGTDGIAGFSIQPDGTLAPLAGSEQPLSAAATGPAQIGFSNDGSVLIVTEKLTNTIDTFVVGPDGLAGPPRAFASSGVEPFGFSVDARNRLIVTEAFGGAADQSAVSVYDIAEGGALGLVDGSVPTLQTAACWAASTQSSRFVYTTNTGSNSVTGFRVGEQGQLTPLSNDGRTGETAATPIDIDTVGNRFVYVLTAGGHQVQGFRIGQDGALEPLNSVGGLPAGDVGLIAR